MGDHLGVDARAVRDQAGAQQQLAGAASHCVVESAAGTSDLPAHAALVSGMGRWLHGSVPLELKVVNPPAIAGVVLRCVSDDFEVRDREGRTGRGFTNLKRVLGRPADFAFVVGHLARTVPRGHAVAACDEGAWALVGAVALHLGVPAVLVRRVPKKYFVSYGDDPAIGDGRLAGERLAPGTPVHLIDDLVFSGQTLRSARAALGLVGLDARTASAILWTYRADASVEELAAAGMTEITCLVHQSAIPG